MFCCMKPKTAPLLSGQPAAPGAADQVHHCTQAATAMQRIGDALGAGLTWHTSGWIDVGKLPGFIAKLATRYPELGRDRHFVHRRRRAGMPVHKLVVFALKDSDRAYFTLLASAPDEQERWLAGTESGTRPALWHFHALRATKPGTDAPAWTWRLTKAAHGTFRAQVIEWVRSHQDRRLLDFIEEACRWPGFAGVRLQYAGLGKLAAGEWARSRAAGETAPAWPRMGYIRRRRTR